MKRLEGKIALITGASRGIGRGIALCMAEEGADVVINDIANAAEAGEVVDSIKQMGRRALALEADVSDPVQVERIVEGAVEHLGGLDIVVANAAFTIRQTVTEARLEDVQRVLALGQLGVFSTCQFAARQMVAQGRGGKVIIIGSIQGEMAFPACGAYSMAKAAVNHLARVMAIELAEHRINVNVINPGWIDTPGERKLYTDEEIQHGAKRLLWGRLGTPRDIGRCAVFLASDDADYITGTSLRVDGGFTLRPM